MTLIWLSLLGLALLNGVLGYLFKRRWGKAFAIRVWAASVFLVGLSMAFLGRYSAPNRAATFSHIHGYIGIASGPLLLDAYNELRERAKLTAEKAGHARGSAPKVVLYGRPELKSEFDRLRFQMPGAVFEAVPLSTVEEREEGMLLKTILADVRRRIRSPGSGMAPDGEVVLFYPRDRLGVGVSPSLKIAQVKSEFGHLHLSSISEPVGERNFSLPEFRVEDCPATVPPGTSYVAAHLKQEGRLEAPTHVEAFTLKAFLDPATGKWLPKREEFIRLAGGGWVLQQGENSGEAGPWRIDHTPLIDLRILPPPRSGAGEGTPASPLAGSKTLVVRRRHLGANGVVETVSSHDQILTSGVVPAAFPAGPTAERSKLYQGLQAADPRLTTALGLILTPESLTEDLRKLTDANPGVLIVDADDFSGSPYTPASFIQLRVLLSRAPAAPSLLLIGDVKHLGVAGAQTKSLSTPRKVLLFVDTSGSTAQFSGYGPVIKRQLVETMGVRSFSEDAVNVLGPFALEYELYAVFVTAHDKIKDPSVSDIICIYDSINPGGSDNRWVAHPNGGRGSPGVPPNHPEGARRFYKYFPSPGPDLWLAVIQTQPGSLGQHFALRDSHPERMHFHDQVVTYGGDIKPLADWIQNQVMPRLEVSMDPRGGLFPISEQITSKFRQDLDTIGKRALVNSFCDFKSRDEWRKLVAAEGGSVILWTEHWHKGLLPGDPASPFLVRLPTLDAEGRKIPAYQVCLELVANLAKDGSSEQRQKLGDIFMHLINCSAAFASSVEVEASAVGNGVEFRQRDSSPFGLDPGDPGPLLRLKDANSGRDVANWVGDLSRMDRPKILIEGRGSGSLVYDAGIKRRDQKADFSLRIASPPTGLGVVRERLGVSAERELPPVVAVDRSWEIPGAFLPWVGLSLAVCLALFVRNF